VTIELPLVQELDPPPDPLTACERFAGLPYRLFLDSAATDHPTARYSFLTADPPIVLRGRGGSTTYVDTTGRNERAVDVLTAARELLAAWGSRHIPWLPPFQAGLAGYLGYELGQVLERLPAPRYDDLYVPHAHLGLYDWVLAWDHRQARAWLISTGVPERGSSRASRARSRLAGVLERLAAPGPSELGPRISRTPVHEPAPSWPLDLPASPPGSGPVRSTFARGAYLEAVERVREYIMAGDIFQANLSQRLQAVCDVHPWILYRRLRLTSPAPFSAYLELDDVAVASASPERFLLLNADRQVETRPIKGTRPRGDTPERDAALAHELRSSEKDRAENLMIVDLLRNDLSRVCRPGTVQATELFALEHYSAVQHLVSTVVGELGDRAGAVDLLAAAFPGGSVTGAPKIRAMEIIAELEPTTRGVYSGSIGYLGLNGAMDTSIAIRTCVVTGNTVYFPVGGGIVADSDPEAEYQETLEKARGMVQGLGTRD
jgi:para-aminobenzoate synthetase component 1